MLRPAFELAVEDDTIFRSPFDFPLSSVVVNDSLTRDALTPQQERNFLSFVKNDSHFNKYYDVIYLLFNTGMRISEFCGLTIRDVNLRTREIRIDHQLVRVGMVYLIEPPKTDAGIRTLPMTDDVY